ncbi:MAG: hypothetical protein H0U94_02495 [Acidobacteria bacterium]|nr:hypothetical protein [Acidobacteriota bacterium]
MARAFENLTAKFLRAGISARAALHWLLMDAALAAEDLQAGVTITRVELAAPLPLAPEG